MRVALAMTELEFITAVENAIKSIDGSAKIIPLSGSTNTRSTSVETFTLGIVSPMEKRQDVFNALTLLVKPWRDVATYNGWNLNIDKTTGYPSEFSAVVHTITAKLHAKSC